MAFPADYTLLGKFSTVLAEISGSHTALPLLITEAMLTAGEKTALFGNTDNGGGDVRVSSDEAGSSQLALDLQSWDTSGETCLMWVPRTCDDTTIADIYIWGDNTGDSQPAAASTFGSEGVWSSSKLRCHMNTTLSDASGKHTLNFDNSTPTTGQIGEALSYNGSTQYSHFTDAGANSELGNSFRTSAWFTVDAAQSAKAILCYDDNSTGSYKHLLYVSGASESVAAYVRLTSGTTYAASYNTGGVITGEHRITATFDRSLGSARLKLYYDGVEVATNNAANLAVASNADGITISRWGGTANFGGDVDEVDVTGWISADRELTEYSNQNDPASFWTFTEAGSTITVNGATPNYTYASVAGSIDLTGLISVTGSTPNYAYSPISGTIDLTPTISVTGATPNYTYSAIAGTVETPGTISVTGVTPNYTYSSVAGTITLFGTITVTGETPNYSYASVRGVIQFGENVYTNSFVGFVPDQGVFSGIVKRATFSGIISETSDFSGYAKVTTFLGVKQ